MLFGGEAEGDAIANGTVEELGDDVWWEIFASLLEACWCEREVSSTVRLAFALSTPDSPLASIGMLSLCSSTISSMAFTSRSLSSSVRISGRAASAKKAVE